MSRHSDEDVPRSVYITTRWTPAEAAHIDAAAAAKNQTRSAYLRSLVAAERKQGHA